MWSLALHPMTHSIFKCDWIAQRRRNRKRRRRRWRNENKNQDQNRCTISLSMGAIMLVGRDKVTTSEWQRSQYKFIMVCLHWSSCSHKCVEQKEKIYRTENEKRWQSSEHMPNFKMTIRSICIDKQDSVMFFLNFNTLESFTQQIQEAYMLGVYSCWSILFYGAGGHNGYQWDGIYLLIAKTHLTPSISANIHSAQEHSLLTIQTGGI